MGDVPGGVAGAGHREHGARAAGRAVGAAPVHALQPADGPAARADLGQQARAVRAVDDVLGPEVARAGRRRVVAVARRGRAALEVLLERVAAGVGERLADERAADRPSVQGDVGAVGVVLQAGDLGDREHGQRVGDAEQDGQHEQGAQRGQVLADPGGITHVRTSPEGIG